MSPRSPRPTEARFPPWAAFFLLFAIVIADHDSAASGGGPNGTDDAMTNLMDTILGHWRRLEGDPCAEQYPDSLDFRAGGVYMGLAGRQQGFVHWGGGDFEIVPPDRIKLQDQTDMMVDYRLVAGTDRLHFTTADGCEIAYGRAGPGSEG